MKGEDYEDKMFDVSWMAPTSPNVEGSRRPPPPLQVWMFRATCASEGRRNPKWIGLESEMPNAETATAAIF